MSESEGMSGNILGDKLSEVFILHIHYANQIFLFLHHLPETTTLSTATTQVTMSLWPCNGLKRNFAFSHKDLRDRNSTSVEETICAISHVGSRASRFINLDVSPVWIRLPKWSLELN